MMEQEIMEAINKNSTVTVIIRGEIGRMWKNDPSSSGGLIFWRLFLF